MRNIIIALFLLIALRGQSQIHDYNMVLNPTHDPDSIYALLTYNSGDLTGRGRFASLPILAGLLEPFLAGSTDYNFAEDNLTFTGNRTHNASQNSLAIDSVINFFVETNSVSGVLRQMSLVGGTQRHYTAVGPGSVVLYSEDEDNSNTSTITVNPTRIDLSNLDGAYHFGIDPPTDETPSYDLTYNADGYIQKSGRTWTDAGASTFPADNQTVNIPYTISDGTGVLNLAGRADFRYPDNLSDNIVIGKHTGSILTNTGIDNIAIGDSALYNGNTVSESNIALGRGALFNSGSGNFNVAIGTEALYGANGGGPISSSYNVALGTMAGRNTLNGGGVNNVFLGAAAGFTNTTGDRNIYIGRNAGYNETASDRLYIESSNSTTPLIFGNFAADSIQINGELGFTTTAGTANSLTGRNNNQFTNVGQGWGIDLTAGNLVVDSVQVATQYDVLQATDDRSFYDYGTTDMPATSDDSIETTNVKYILFNGLSGGLNTMIEIMKEGYLQFDSDTGRVDGVYAMKIKPMSLFDGAGQGSWNIFRVSNYFEDDANPDNGFAWGLNMGQGGREVDSLVALGNVIESAFAIDGRLQSEWHRVWGDTLGNHWRVETAYYDWGDPDWFAKTYHIRQFVLGYPSVEALSKPYFQFLHQDSLQTSLRMFGSDWEGSKGIEFYADTKTGQEQLSITTYGTMPSTTELYLTTFAATNMNRARIMTDWGTHQGSDGNPAYMYGGESSYGGVVRVTYDELIDSLEANGLASGSSALSGLTAAAATNTIDNADYAQEWKWDILSSNSALKLSSISTAAASNTQRLFHVALSGANSISSQTTYGGYFTNAHTGTSSTNYGVRAIASGGTTNIALSGTAATGSADIGVYGQSTAGYGISGQSVSDFAVVGETNTSPSILAARNDNGTTDKLNLITLRRLTTGTSGNGIGGEINFEIEADNGTAYLSNVISSSWSTADDLTRTSQLLFQGVNSTATTDVLAIDGDGGTRMHTYGDGTHTGTATKWAAWDTDGNLIEEAPPGVGSAHTIRDDGSDETQRTGLNFVSTSTINMIGTDDAGNNETEIAANIIAASVGNTELGTGIDVSQFADGTVSDAEFQRIGSLTSDAQTQLDGKVNNTGNENVAGVKTYTSDPIIPDEAVTSAFDGVLEPVTKNAYWDDREYKLAGHPAQSLTNSTASDQDYTSIYTIPANAIVENTVYRVTLGYQFTTGVSTVTFVHYLKLGSTKVFTQAVALNITNSVTRSITASFLIQGTAAAGASANVETMYGYTNFPSGDPNMNSTAQPVALATNGTLSVTPGVTYSGTGSTETMVLRTFLVEKVN